MPQKTKLRLRVPINIGAANFGQRVLKQYLRNSKTAYRQEQRKLLKEIEQHSLNIYNLVIKAFYDSYTPTVYTRHGNIAGFNLYYPYGVDVSNNIAYDLNPGKLLPYGFGDGGVERPTRNYIYMLVLLGIRMFPSFVKKPFAKRNDPSGKKRLSIVKNIPRRYKLKINYPLPGRRIKNVYSGTPHEILREASNTLVMYYNRELIVRMRKAIMSLNDNIVWVK